MNTTTMGWNRLIRFAAAGVCLALAACSGTSRPKPTEIQGVTVLQDIRTAWTANVGKVDFPLVVSSRQDRLAVANSQGLIAVLDAATGKDIWRLKLDQPIAAGVGSDGQQVAVVTRTNELVTLRNGQVEWRVGLPAQSFSAPLASTLDPTTSRRTFGSQTSRRYVGLQRHLVGGFVWTFGCFEPEYGRDPMGVRHFNASRH